MGPSNREIRNKIQTVLPLLLVEETEGETTGTDEIASETPQQNEIFGALYRRVAARFRRSDTVKFREEKKTPEALAGFEGQPTSRSDLPDDVDLRVSSHHDDA